MTTEATEARENDVRSLLKAGVELDKLEELYGANLVHEVAKTVISEDTHKGRLTLAPLLLSRAKSSRLRSILADDNVLDKVVLSLLAEPEDENLLDPLMMTLMNDPVVLSSGFVVDRSTAIDESGEMRLSECPFSRQTLIPTVYPIVPINAKIRKFEVHRLDQCIEVVDRFVTADHWDRAEQVLDIANDLLDTIGDAKYPMKAKRLANMEKRTPRMNTVDRTIKVYRRLLRVAPPEEIDDLVADVIRICLEKTKCALNEEGGASKARDWSKSCFDFIRVGGFSGHAKNNFVELCRMLMDCFKVLDDQKETWAQRRIIATLLTGDDLSSWLASEGITGNEQEMRFSQFDPTIWPADVWLDSSKGIARVGERGSNAHPQIACKVDLNPLPHCDHWIEVAFYPMQLNYQSSENSIFSQHGSGNGWEIRCGEEHVELVWTTRSDFNWDHNEFVNSSPASLLTHKWTHVAIAYEHLSSKVTMFVDGIPESRTISGSFQPNSNLPLLGRNVEWKDRYLEGYVAFASAKSELPVAPNDLCSHVSQLSEKRHEELSSFELPTGNSLPVCIPIDRCYDVQWNPPGHPRLVCSNLRAPFLELRGKERDGYYTFIEEDGMLANMKSGREISCRRLACSKFFSSIRSILMWC